MADVTSLCERVILLHQGRILYDGDLSNLAIKLAPFKLIQVRGQILNEDLQLKPEIEILSQDENQATFRIPRDRTPELIAFLLNTVAITDLTVEDPPIEAVIDQIYREGEACLI
jgi:ABC-2 type transport system ATP-binding protein